MRGFASVLAAVFCLVLTACEGQPRKGSQPVLAEAFTGPIELPLRAEVSPASKNIATARHGEKLEVIQVRRRFVRVRTPRGDEGWTESRHLLTGAQMQALAQQARDAAKLPSQGEATVFEALNIHTDPSRQSTSFYKITEGKQVSIVAHRLVPRVNTPQQQFQIPRKPVAAPAKKPKKEPAIPPPPKPPAPGLPENWQELSKTRLPEPPPPPPEDPADSDSKKKLRNVATKPPVPLEDWYLVRTQDGKAGWVLSRMLHMSIPDEVAQYSEGARITSYFALGDVYDGDQKKYHWLWTTVREGQVPYQFDSFRIFTWVTRRHRYETAYIERGLEGFYPVTVKPGPTPQFSLVSKQEDGTFLRKTYVLEGYLVRKIGEEPYRMDTKEGGAEIISRLPEDEKDPAETASWTDRIKNLFRREEDPAKTP